MSATPSLLGPNARPMVAIGHGPGVWKSRHIKGILCSFQWLDLVTLFSYPDTEDNRCAPCMVLLNPRSMDKGAKVIPQWMAFEYGTVSGQPTPHCIASGFDTAQMLGFDLRDRSAAKVAIDIIIEGIPDLVQMPTEPPNTLDALVKKHTHGIEATAKINGQTIHREVL